jgi:ABC-type proline/glycine betaine transport system ATPase subunit
MLRKRMKALKEELSLPIIHVTHDLDEALYLGDEVLPIVEGRVSPEWLDRQLKEMKEESRFYCCPENFFRVNEKSSF